MALGVVDADLTLRVPASALHLACSIPGLSHGRRWLALTSMQDSSVWEQSVGIWTGYK